MSYPKASQQKKAPLFDALLKHAKRQVVSFHTPGHKNGDGIDKRLRQFTGRNVYYLDVTTFPEVDSLHDPITCIKQAQKLYADLCGVKHTFFMLNGSSMGNQAMLMSACKPGDSVIMSRNCHKSVLGGVILSGIWPIWVQPKIDQKLDIIFDLTPEQVELAIKQYPEARAVYVTSPTYNGVVTDLEKIADIAHRYGKILLVDEAHGPHLKFHPDLPMSAVEAGADMCVQSTHKILSALSQGSVLHFNSDLVDLNHVKRVVSLLQTTSPNYFILSSIDLARRQMWENGERLVDKMISISRFIRKRLKNCKRIMCFDENDIERLGYELDPSKVTINVTRTGLDGHEISEILNHNYRVQVDCADIFNLIAILGTGSSMKDARTLADALVEIDEKYIGKERYFEFQLPSLSTEMVMSPRET
ncbi:MAG: aminotransferase class I/II-fold pyridoxal phosphate-dependent enzyme, partial [Elusimicrobiota bacterium]